MKWSAMLVVALAVTFGSVVAQERGDVTHTKDSIPQVRENLEEGKALLLDVREKEEWDAGHLAVAKLVPLSMLRDLPEGTEGVEGLPKDKILYLHCRSGRRVLTAAPVLQALGYDVRPLPWGYDALVDEGFESDPGNPK